MTNIDYEAEFAKFDAINKVRALTPEEVTACHRLAKMERQRNHTRQTRANKPVEA